MVVCHTLDFDPGGIMDQLRRSLSTLLVLGTVFICTIQGHAQFSIYNSNGFEGFAIDPLSPQDDWQTTDLNQIIGSTPAGVIQSSVTFSGNRAVQMIGPNLFDDGGFSNQTFWWQDRTAAPFNPVLNGTPVVRTVFRQRYNGTIGDTSQIPFAGVYFEGLNTSGVQRPITSVLFDFAGRITAITAGDNSFSTPTIPDLFNTWQNMRVELNFTTNRFTVFMNDVAMTPLINLPFRNSNINRLVEFGFQGSTLGVGIPPTNTNYYDDFVVTAFAVPEPGTYALFSVLLLGAVVVRNWRKTRKPEEHELIVE